MLFKQLQSLDKPQLRLVLVAVVLVALLGLALLFLRPGPLRHQPLPDFSAIQDIPERKAAFFAFLDPYINEANTDILEQRERLAAIRDHLPHGPLNRRESRWVRRLAWEYGMDLDAEAPVTMATLDALLLRVDIIPASMALSQAALESGWGTSRFARQGNNLFGIWCYEPGCGIVPKHRPPGKTYEVARYRSPKESFRDYIRNLNSNPAYQTLWELRQMARQDGEIPTGMDLSEGLYRYSQEGWTYVGKIQGMIQANDLDHYDTVVY